MSGSAKRGINGKQGSRFALTDQAAQSVAKEGAEISLFPASTTYQLFTLRSHRKHSDGTLLDMPREPIPSMNGNAKKDTYGRLP